MSNPFVQDTLTRDDREHVLPQLLVTVGEITERAGDAFVFGRFGLTTGRYALLSTLACLTEPPSITQLKEWVLRSAANLTQTIDILERDGLVRREPSPSDRRVSLVQLTDKGRNVLRNVDDYFQRSMTDYLSDYTDEELEIFVKLLQRFGNKTLQALLTPPLADLPPNVHARIAK